ncbi:MAG: hypothetical protein RIS60_36 [Pseudomonadota bacterium]
MMTNRLDGQRVLLTQATEFMGPALISTFQNLGAEMLTDDRALNADPNLPKEIVEAAGRVDILLLHLALPAPSTAAIDIQDEEWRSVFAHLVDPMPRLVSAVLPQMIERRKGRILLMGSAAALRGIYGCAVQCHCAEFCRQSNVLRSRGASQPQVSRQTETRRTFGALG